MLFLLIILKNNNFSNHLKLLFISLLFAFTLIVESDLFFHLNEIKINSVKPIATFINENSNNKKRTVIIYDRLLPSLSFYLNQPIITVNNGRYTTQRETFFETNHKWKKHIINYKIKEERNLLIELTSKNTFLIIRENVIEPDTIMLFRTKLIHSKKLGKYLVYY